MVWRVASFRQVIYLTPMTRLYHFNYCRIVKLERMGTADDKILTDLKFMIKKVSSSLTSTFLCFHS